MKKWIAFRIWLARVISPLHRSLSLTASDSEIHRIVRLLEIANVLKHSHPEVLIDLRSMHDDQGTVEIAWAPLASADCLRIASDVIGRFGLTARHIEIEVMS